MAGPAAVLGDQVTATCAAHMVPNPTSGAPQPGPPMPFAAPVTTGAATTVLIAGKPALVQGSSGLNASVHPGLHPSDPFMAPAMQKATITGGSATVLIEGRPAASTGAPCVVCFGAPGTLTGTAATVVIGG
jgi:uncharacterized Zn-binding protein involved in type VI secretion